MIAHTLDFLAKELNAYLDQRLMASSIKRVVVGNVARALDTTGGGPDGAIGDKVVLTLVNLEEERSVRLQETVVRTATTARYKNAPLQLNLYVLVSVTKDDYPDALVQLGHVVQFFQFQNVFTPLTHPGLQPRVERLVLELYTMNFEQVNHLWSTLGGKYLPCALYKVRQITVDEEAVTGESGLIREIRLDGRGREAVP
jgi:hypothetical protein